MDQRVGSDMNSTLRSTNEGEEGRPEGLRVETEKGEGRVEDVGEGGWDADRPR